MKALRPLILLCTLGLLVVPALGDDPDLEEIIRKADQTIRTVKAVSYKSKVWVEGDLPIPQPRFETTVKAREHTPGEPPLLWIDGLVKLPNTERTHPIHVIANRKQAASFNNAKKICTIGDLPGAAELVIEVAKTVVMREFLHPAPFADELSADSREYEGTKTIGGTECHVIHVVYKGGEVEARWYFGVEDSLPHRVDRLQPGSGGTRFRALELSDIDTTPKFDEQMFVIRVPEGFERREYTRPEPPRAPRAPAGLLKVGSEAPDWTLKSSTGEAVTLSKLRGKVVFLDFWATWCRPCTAAMPKVQALHKKYKDRPVTIFGVSVWERSDAAAYMKQKKYTYPLLLKGDQVANAYGVRGIPTLYVIGADGKVLYASTGFGPTTEDEVIKHIDKSLRELD